MTTTATISTLLFLTHFLNGSGYTSTILICTNSAKQNVSIPHSSVLKMFPDDAVILFNTDIPPVYKYGGDIGLKKFISKNIHYPNGQCVTGKVYVGFTVNILGDVKNIQIIRGITKETDKEAMRIVKMLTFIPGTKMAKPIETKMILPFDFTIKNNKR